LWRGKKTDEEVYPGRRRGDGGEEHGEIICQVKEGKKKTKSLEYSGVKKPAFEKRNSATPRLHLYREMTQ